MFYYIFWRNSFYHKWQDCLCRDRYFCLFMAFEIALAWAMLLRWRRRSIFIIIIIIIVLSCYQHGYPWSSLATPLYRLSLLAGRQGFILYHHRAAVCRFELVALLLLGHVRGSMGEHRLWAHPCFSSSVLHVWFVWSW